MKLITAVLGRAVDSRDDSAALVSSIQHFLHFLPCSRVSSPTLQKVCPRGVTPDLEALQRQLRHAGSSRRASSWSQAHPSTRNRGRPPPKQDSPLSQSHSQQHKINRVTMMTMTAKIRRQESDGGLRSLMRQHPNDAHPKPAVEYFESTSVNMSIQVRERHPVAAN